MYKRQHITDAAPIYVMFLVIALVERGTSRGLVHRVGVVLNWLVLLVFILAFAGELGGLAPDLDLGF